MEELKISVLDQSPIHDSKSPKEGLFDTIKLARFCDELGYYRYWLAEHHNTPGYASSNPEIMINSVANATKNIKVGSGGIMLNHYNPFKVAETFNALESLHENRIDLGIGRASGANYATSQALHDNSGNSYSQKAYELIGYLNQNLPKEHPFHNVSLTLKGIKAPLVYLLGSSEGSSKLAGELGAGFVLALFIGTHHRSVDIIKEYKKNFRISSALKKPKAILAIACIVADSKEEAEYIASTHTYWKLQAFTKPNRDALLSPKHLEPIIKNLDRKDRSYYEETMDTMILGTAKECKKQIELLAKTFEVDEVMIVNVTYSFEHRKRSYELLAKEFNLKNT